MALTPSELRRRKMNLLMAMSYAAFASTKASTWSPTLLFSAGEQGAWYDPSDFSTMFTDAAGTTPVTAVEQPVGLLLDKSKGLALGSERITNGGFDSTAWWGVDAGWSISGGVATNTGADQIYTPLTTLEANKRYEISFDVTSVTTSGALVVVVGVTNVSLTVASTGRYTLRAADATGGRLRFGSGTGHSWRGSIDNVTVKEIAGNHASQSTAASRPVLSARVNLLTYSEQFDNAVWTVSGIRAFGSGSVANTTATTDPLGGNAADLLVENNDSAAHFVYREVSTSVKNFTFSIYAKAKERSVLVITLQDGSGNPPPYAVFNLATETYTVNSGSVPSSSGATASITSVGNEWYRCKLTANNYSSGAVYPIICLSNSATPTLNTYSRPEYTGDITKGIYIWGADLRATNAGVNLPAYQRVITSTDYDTSGFPLYLKFDGVDDSLATGTIDPGSVDKAQVFAGVRKLSDAATGMLFEYSANYGGNVGSLGVYLPTTGVFNALVNGSPSSPNGADSSIYAAPTTRLLTTIWDIGQTLPANEIKIRVNGSADTATPMGGAQTGNFSAYPLYIGRRGGSSLPFNGQVYSMILRFSAANLSDAQIASTETYVNNLTKAY